MIEAYLTLERETGDRMDDADMAADIADNAMAQGYITEDEVDLFIHQVEGEIPYYRGS